MNFTVHFDIKYSKTTSLPTPMNSTRFRGPEHCLESSKSIQSVACLLVKVTVNLTVPSVKRSGNETLFMNLKPTILRYGQVKHCAEKGLFNRVVCGWYLTK